MENIKKEGKKKSVFIINEINNQITKWAVNMRG